MNISTKFKPIDLLSNGSYLNLLSTQAYGNEYDMKYYERSGLIRGGTPTKYIKEKSSPTAR